MTMTAAELVASKKHIFLDFDGPICAAFAGYGAINISRQLASLIDRSGVSVPIKLHDSSDPFELLRFAAGSDNGNLLVEVDSELRRLELCAVAVARPTQYALDAIEDLAAKNHELAVVSNNSLEAVSTFLSRNNFARSINTVSARTRPEPSLLKPNPHLVINAMTVRGAAASETVMIGDSVSDVEAARLAGIPAIAFANKPGKAILRS